MFKTERLQVMSARVVSHNAPVVYSMRRPLLHAAKPSDGVCIQCVHPEARGVL